MPPIPPLPNLPVDVVFALGSNGSGQLGIGHKEDVSKPRTVKFGPDPMPDPVVGFAAGGNHSLILTREDDMSRAWRGDGKVKWAGDMKPGCCSFGNPPKDPGFWSLRIPKFEDPYEEYINDVKAVAATWEASLIVVNNDDGFAFRVYSFGTGSKGELGLGPGTLKTDKPTLIKDFPPRVTGAFQVVDLAASMGHVVAVMDNGDAYAWGNCRKGQGGSPDEIIYSPRKIKDVGFKAVRAVCGSEFTCLFGEPGSGKIKVLGSDKWGIQSNAPATAPDWKDVGASWGGVYILAKDGNLHGWGRDNHGQLPPPNLPKLDKIAVGSEHVVALTDEGDVLSWGWGEHGNCGPKVENNDVKGRWNVLMKKSLLPPGSRIYGVGAGCATTFYFAKWLEPPGSSNDKRSLEQDDSDDDHSGKKPREGEKEDGHDDVSQ